jgi:acyl-CoA synthetase (AMP-forming)/AMP-acid ligase II
VSDDPCATASTTLELLEWRATRIPAALAYGVGRDTATYGQLGDAVRRAAAGLTGAGLRPGSQCAVLLSSGIEFVVAVFAIQAAGSVPVPIDARLPPDLIRRRLALTRCSGVIASEADAPALRGPLEESFVVTTPGELARAPLRGYDLTRRAGGDSAASN